MSFHFKLGHLGILLEYIGKLESATSPFKIRKIGFALGLTRKTSTLQLKMCFWRVVSHTVLGEHTEGRRTPRDLIVRTQMLVVEAFHPSVLELVGGSRQCPGRSVREKHLFFVSNAAKGAGTGINHQAATRG